MNSNFKDVVQHIYDYFEEHLSQYTVFEVRRQSYNPNDDYLYMVAAKKQDGTYAVWTSWNESIKSLNWGHHDLPDMKTCTEIMTEYQNAHSKDDAENSPLEYLQELLIKRDDNFADSYQELLYVMGYVAGINLQQKHNWKKLKKTEINELFEEAVKE